MASPGSVSAAEPPRPLLLHEPQPGLLGELARPLERDPAGQDGHQHPLLVPGDQHRPGRRVPRQRGALQVRAGRGIAGVRAVVGERHRPDAGAHPRRIRTRGRRKGIAGRVRPTHAIRSKNTEPAPRYRPAARPHRTTTRRLPLVWAPACSATPGSNGSPSSRRSPPTSSPRWRWPARCCWSAWSEKRLVARWKRSAAASPGHRRRRRWSTCSTGRCCRSSTTGWSPWGWSTWTFRAGCCARSKFVGLALVAFYGARVATTLIAHAVNRAPARRDDRPAPGAGGGPDRPGRHLGPGADLPARQPGGADRGRDRRPGHRRHRGGAGRPGHPGRPVRLRRHRVRPPFSIGDYIVVDNFMGTVEHIGIKTTRVRSSSGELIVFGNSNLAGARIRNFRSMYRRRVVFNFGVIYQTPTATLEQIPGVVREILAALPSITVDRVHFQAFGPGQPGLRGGLLRGEPRPRALHRSAAEHQPVDQAALRGDGGRVRRPRPGHDRRPRRSSRPERRSPRPATSPGSIRSPAGRGGSPRARPPRARSSRPRTAPDRWAPRGAEERRQLPGLLAARPHLEHAAEVGAAAAAGAAAVQAAQQLEKAAHPRAP